MASYFLYACTFLNFHFNIFFSSVTHFLPLPAPHFNELSSLSLFGQWPSFSSTFFLTFSYLPLQHFLFLFSDNDLLLPQHLQLFFSLLLLFLPLLSSTYFFLNICTFSSLSSFSSSFIFCFSRQQPQSSSASLCLRSCLWEAKVLTSIYLRSVWEGRSWHPFKGLVRGERFIFDSRKTALELNKWRRD